MKEKKNMAHIIEYKISFEIDDEKLFGEYEEEWVNNNSFARYRIVDEEYIGEYWTPEKKENIEDYLYLFAQINDMNFYENKYGIVFITDNKNKIRVCIDKDSQNILYARDVKFTDIGRWIEFCLKK